jgi:hypothetical protein
MSMLSLSLLVGCTGAGPTDDIVPKTTSTSSSLTGFPELGPELVVTDEHTHSFVADWVIPSSPIRADLDATIDWSGVTADAYGVARDPAAFEVVALFHAVASRTEVARLLEVDQLETVVDASWTASVSGQTEVRLSAIDAFDPAVWLVEDPSAVLLFALCDRVGERLDIRTGVVLEPSEAEGGSVLPLSAGARMEWAAELDGDTLRTQTGHDDYPLDWSAVTTDGYGEPYDAARADELFLARYDDVDEADDLTGRLLDLEATAAGWWTAPLAGEASVSLSDLAGFPGLEAGVYLVGARCTTCLGPAPLWAAGLEVR